MPGPVRNPTEAYQQLEAIMLRQMLQSSGAFRAGTSPGAQLRTDMFVETLADAVAKAGGLGIARMLERQLGGGTASPTPTAARRLSSSPSIPGSPGGVKSMSIAATSANPIDDLDDPNSEAPLPEDSAAQSIDEYQTGPAQQNHGVAGRPASASHLHLEQAGPNHLSDGHGSVKVPISIARALNRYRERDEVSSAGTPLGAGRGDKP
jgi:Rod binding domain-containing protein